MRLRNLALSLCLSAALIGCGASVPEMKPAQTVEQKAVDLSYKTIETMRTALVTALQAARELHDAGIVDDAEREAIRGVGKDALAAIKAANTAIMLYLKGASEQATAEDQVRSAAAALNVVESQVASWRNRHAPRNAVKDSEVPQ